MELRGLLESVVFGIRVNSLFLEGLSDYLALDESFGPSEVLEGAHNFRVGGDYIFFDVGMLGPLLILHPGSAVILVGSVVESAFGCASEGVPS